MGKWDIFIEIWINCAFQFKYLSFLQLSYPVQELNQAHLESNRKDFQRSERRVLASTLNVADVRSAQSHVLGKIVLVPSLCLAQRTNPLAQPHANIFCCHPFSMDVSFWLYFANWLHFQRKMGNLGRNRFMNRMAVVTLLVFSAPVFAQTSPIHSGSTVYIAPMDGYETYLSAAIVKKHVPLVVVADKDKADYLIQSTVAHKSLNSSPTVVVNNTVNNGSQPTNPVAESMQRGYEAGAAQRRALGETSASIAVIDAHSSQVLFAHAAGKMGTNQLQNTAEDCAKHLKEFIEKSEKPKK